MSTEFDVAIIGGGPAGATAAYWSAKVGLRVVVMDAAIFPRDKACGDMLSETAVREIEALGLGAWLQDQQQNDIWKAQYGAPSGWGAEHVVRTRDRSGQLHWATVSRYLLDAKLVDHARNAGAQIWERCRVTHYEVREREVHLTCLGLHGPPISAQLVIVAVGSTGTFVKGRAEQVALRGYFESISKYDLRLVWEKPFIPGYWWRFPSKGNLSNVGIYTTREQATHFNIATELKRIALREQMVLSGKLHGGLVNTSFGTEPVHGERILWVGDAAGLVWPHLGEGIAPALISGRIAASCAQIGITTGKLRNTDLAFYTMRLQATMKRQQTLSRWLYKVMHHPHLFETIAYPVAVGHQRLFRTT